MTQIIDICPPVHPEKKQNGFIDFQKELFGGLSGVQKKINSKYFYDDVGSELFNSITKHPDYYLTACELEIIEKSKHKIIDIINDKPLNLIEFGPGEGIKTELLIDYFLKLEKTFTYIPIDISYQYLDTMSKKLEKREPKIPLMPIHGDYFDGLKWVSLDSDRCNLVLFLGSSIGNFSISEAQEFLGNLRQNLHVGDYVLIGFDLRKDISTLMRAYDDSAGITRAFNLNLLHRINRELGADIDISKFNHYPVYNAVLGAMESYLISLEQQVITFPSLEKSFVFETSEAIHVENSYKYLMSQISTLAEASNFNIIEHYYDSQHYFVDSFWQAR